MGEPCDLSDGGLGLCGAPGDGCTTSRCGDHRVDERVETCDDGNNTGGDGCSTLCQVEEGWHCDEREPSRCAMDEMVIVRAGSFSMGSPHGEIGRDGDELPHEVVLSRDFSIKATEVTQGEFSLLMQGWNPSRSSCDGNDTCPVEWVTWYDAIAYTNSLSEAKGFAACYTIEDVVCESDDMVADYRSCYDPVLGAGRGIMTSAVRVTGVGSVYGCEGFRLPTEAEWEYAARAETVEATYNGDLSEDLQWCDPDPDVMGPIAWYCGNCEAPQPVGQRLANPWLLYDMAGNVWEWCHDLFGPYPAGKTWDPVGPFTDLPRCHALGDDPRPGVVWLRNDGSDPEECRVKRGGSWGYLSKRARSANRWGDQESSSNRSNDTGFRVVRTLR